MHPKPRHRAILLGLGLLGVALAAGCDLPLFTATHTDSEVFATPSAPRIVVETFNGSIDISNGADDEVVVEVTRRASGFDQRSADENLDQIEVAIFQDDDVIRVVARRAGHTFGNAGASVVIAAPPDSQIELKSSNGYIVSEGMRGDIVADTSNAKIGIYEATGRLTAETSNASIEIEADDAIVDAGTSNARIRFAGSLADAEHQFHTSNASIDVRLPVDSNFRFDAETSNANVDCGFPYEGTDSKRRRKVHGTVGDHPRCELELSTSNASIDIRPAD